MFEDLEEEIEIKAEEIGNKRCREIMCYGHCSFSSPKHHRCGEWHREYNCAKEGIEYGYSKASEWHYVKDKLPPEPEGEDGKILPKTYICAYRLSNACDDFETGDFMYLGSGVWNGENKEYPIYAWLDSPVDIPEPPKEQDQ